MGSGEEMNGFKCDRLCHCDMIVNPSVLAGNGKEARRGDLKERERARRERQR